MNNFVKRGILLPLITALVFGALFYLFVSGSVEKLAAIPNHTAVLYHDELNPPLTSAGSENGEWADNALLGTITGKGELKLRYHADYSVLAQDASLLGEGARLDEIGASYIEIGNNNADKLGNAITVSGEFGTLRFRRAGESECGSREQALQVSPRAENSVVVIYQERGKGALSSRFKAVVFEEVG